MDIYAKDIKKPKPALFYNIKFFVLCHGLLQLTQLLYSSYFKSTITTIERRYGLDSLSSGTISSLHEVGNTVLIAFVSYMGSRVHRPRFIGLGGLLMSISAMILALPHFLSQPYTFDSVLHASKQDMCYLHVNATGAESCGQEDSRKLVDTSKFWVLMATAQLLFGIGSVPIQPFGISYIDDFAGVGNSALYIAILFAVSVFGPSFGYLLGSVVLRIYVDVDRASTGGALELTPTDPRWVGAWWMGLLITSGGLALTSIPYFFFPRTLHVEKPFELESDILKEDPKKSEGSMLDFLKMFPKMFIRLLLSPVFMLLVLTQCCFSSVIAGLATFLNKFLERQYSASAAYSSLLIGALNLPSIAVGMVLGGLIMKRWGLSFRAIPRFSVVMLTISIFCCLPLFFMGCPTQNVADVYGVNGTPPLSCHASCSCSNKTFNPVCGENNIEYVSPCTAGCTNFTMDPKNSYRVQIYSNCKCIPGLATAKPGPCANTCPHYLLPVMLLISLAGLIASLTHNPIYMMVLRSVPSEEKSFAIGVQFLLLRVLTWLPAPALFGMTIDSTCIKWKMSCGKKQGCGYYDNNLLRNRYLGLQLGYKTLGIALLAFIGWKMQRTREYSLENKLEGPM
ncbi:solute carrier organic anion transporter family member 2A1 [Cyprinus carpio]|uniref:Solute carrier organic anion transporter family member n=1 Tax=Cyprinus carpio TaxID=7962 RepID=A0A9Q9WE72_CYPCA|nr:solute carrier organic anion transporter family member 2A1 [Cyprinus carpio]